MPEIRPFRALRYDPEVVGDMGLVVSPPYDVISAAERARLAARHPRNVVRIELPVEETGDAPEDRYRRAARDLVAWRADGSLRKDPRPALYAYEQTYRAPGSSVERVQRGFFGRLRLEPFGPGGGVLPHERTLAGPKEDRHKLLRATGANVSPIVGLYTDAMGTAGPVLASIAASSPAADLVDDDGVRHRLWVVPEVADRDGGAVRELVRCAGAGPITIADGHHRYETALRYRDERRLTRSCEPDPPFDFVLMLLLETTTEPLMVLATHRVVGDVDDATGLLRAASDFFDTQPVRDRAPLEARFASGNLAAGGAGRIGLWTRAGGAILTARRAAFEPFLPRGSEALRRLDVTLLGVVLERLCGVDSAAVAAGGRVAYTKSAGEAIDWVDKRVEGADAAFLLEPTPVAEIVATAVAGDVMPQKSTYFYPKALTGLVINPLEW